MTSVNFTSWSRSPNVPRGGGAANRAKFIQHSIPHRRNTNEYCMQKRLCAQAKVTVIKQIHATYCYCKKV